MYVRRIVPLASILLLLALPLGGCGSDDENPIAPTPQGTLSLSKTSIDFGVVGSYSVVDVTVTADATNRGDLTVSPGFAVGGSSWSVAPDREFTLAPGEDRVISVGFHVATPGRQVNDVLLLGVESAEISVTGFASAAPRYGFTPTALSSGTVSTNYSGFSGGKVGVDYGTGRSHGDSPSWVDCAGTARWIFNGQGISESTVGWTFPVPNGTSSVSIQMQYEAEEDCVQRLIQIDGTEHRSENLAGGCYRSSQAFDLSGGSHEIRVGTDQQGFCGGDLHLMSVEFVFRGTLVQPGSWVD